MMLHPTEQYGHTVVVSLADVILVLAALAWTSARFSPRLPAATALPEILRNPLRVMFILVSSLLLILIAVHKN
jgi:hypothetical protein